MKKLFGILLTLLLFPVITFASGKMIIGVGETVTLNAKSDLPSPEFKWVLLEDEKIIDSQSGQYYSRLFQAPGAFKLNLTAQSSFTHEVENSFVEVLVGQSKGFADSLNIQLHTLPKVSADGTLLLSEQQNEVSFILSSSKGNIKEYRIDTDINTDTDGDSNTENDIDNIDATSFSTGDIWAFTYDTEQIPTTAKITIFDNEGRKEEQLLNIQRKAPGSEEALLAVLELSPSAADDKRVHLTGNSEDVFIFSGNSKGEILEYRIDTDTTIDSDGDGNPANDIDNLNHNSFYTGEVFTLPMKRALGDRVVQLTIVGSGGKGSRIQRKIIWDTSENLEKTGEFEVFADKTSAFTGEAVHFGIDGPIKGDGYEIKWDFNGDKSTDLTGADTLAAYTYDTAGTYEVLVQIKNEEKQLLKYATIQVAVETKPASTFSTLPPVSDFQFTVEGSTVSFENGSRIDENLLNKELEFEWKFGDGKKSTAESPVHTYTEVKNYIARLKVTDSTGQTHEKQRLIEVAELSDLTDIETPAEETEEEVVEETPVEEGETAETPEEENIPELPENIEKPTTQEGGSIIGFLFMTLLLLVGIATGAVAVYLIVQKVKNPDYTFGEIVEEEKEKVLSILEGREYEAPSGEILSTGEEVKGDVSDILEESDQAESIRKDLKEEPKQEKTEEPKVETQPAPERAASAPKSENIKPVEAPNAEAKQEDVPDWLKDDASAVPATPAEPQSTPAQPETPKAQVPTQEAPAQASVPKQDDVPAWLQDTPTPAATEPTSPQIQEPTQAPQTPPVAPNTPPQQVPPTVDPNTQPGTTPPPPTKDDDDDIPDWLK